MPRLNDQTMEELNNPNTSFTYSGVRIDELMENGSSEYTLVTLVIDRSGSVHPFKNEIEAGIKEVVKACKHSPRADNLMIRLVLFNDDIEEVHGYKLLQNCNPDDYNGVINPNYTTALFDATIRSIDATSTYAKTLADNDLDVNAIVVVITDGLDNVSACTPNNIKDSINNAISSESLESIRTVLVGVNVDLSQMASDAGIDQYEELDNADSNTLAKLFDFISKSISAQSQSLGTGGPSKPISLSI